MKATKTNSIIIDGYVALLYNLSTSTKLDIIAKLTDSLKVDGRDKKSSFKKSFGAFDSNKTAEEINADIRASRISTREIESF